MGSKISSQQLFREFVTLAMRVCREVEQQSPRRGRGRRPSIPDWVIATLVVVAVAAQRKTKSAQLRFIQAHAAEFKELGVWPLPGRTTYFERYQRVWRCVQAAIASEGRLAIQRNWVDARCVAADKSLVAAQGAPAHRYRGRSCRVKNVDLQAGWGRSEHDGWVWGYGYEVIVSAAKQGPVWPLLASVEPANRHEIRMLEEKLPDLPCVTRVILADRGYDSDNLTEAIEWSANGCRTERRFLCPLIRRANARRTPRQAWKRSRTRQLRQAHRKARASYLSSPAGRRLYARRMRTAEPFNAWLKERFQLQHRVWHRGLNNNRTQILAAILAYQLVLHLNRIHRQPSGNITWALDIL